MEHWWDELQNQCPKCKKYLATEFYKETYKFYHFICKFCGYRKRTLVRFAEYRHKGNKVLMRRQGQKEFQEVELRKVKGGLQVVPILQKGLFSKKSGERKNN